MRKIYLHGEVNEAMFTKLSKKLDKLTADGDCSEITIELNSEGGHAYSGIAIYNKIKNCKAPIIIEAYGTVMSAATVILAAGTKRHMAGDAWFMVHDSTSSHEGTVGTLKRNMHQTEKEELQWADILARHSIWSIDQWRAASAKTTYLTAHQLTKIKLIHSILKE